jgi:hypothetical protein
MDERKEHFGESYSGIEEFMEEKTIEKKLDDFGWIQEIFKEKIEFRKIDAQTLEQKN